MVSNELVRRKRGEKGCCACSLTAMLGLLGLTLGGLWTLRQAHRHH
jgi:hypothetical protein